MVFKYSFYFLLFLFGCLSLGACRQSKYIANGEYRYTVKNRGKTQKRTIHFVEKQSDSILKYQSSHDLISVDELNELLKPKPNNAYKLFVYNQIDSMRMNSQINKKSKKSFKKNHKRVEKQNKINKKRYNKAKSEGRQEYNQKVKRLKKIKNGWRYWIIDNIGEPPIIMDSLAIERSAKQLNLFLKNKGFYENSISWDIVYKDWRRKAYPRYAVIPNIPFTIDSIEFENTTGTKYLSKIYHKMVKREGNVLRKGILLDHDILDQEREIFSKICRDEGYFDFSKNYIYFEIDTIGKNHKANILIKIIERTKENEKGDEVIVGHYNYKVNSVSYYVHNTDKASFVDYDNYKKRLDNLGLSDYGGDFPLIDTLNYFDSAFVKKYFLFGSVDTIIYQGVFVFNEALPVTPFLFDRHNFLEVTDGGDNGWYKEYYVERSYSKMLGLDIFSSINPSVSYSTNLKRRVDIKYDLTPEKKQQFSFEPNATNSNGYLGLAMTVNYINKNLLGGAEKFKFSLTGGAESQPAIFDKTIIGGKTKTSNRQLNTIEIYPKISLEIPKLIPMRRSTQKTMSKRLYPVTVFDLSYNYQKRADFTRNLTEFGYSWRFNEAKTKVHHLKWQSFNYVNLAKSPEFEILLNQLNDPFLLNTYNDHFSNKFEYVFNYNNQKEKKKKGVNNSLFMVLTGSTSGYLFDQFGVGQNDINSNGLKQILGVPFTQFLKFDSDIRFYLQTSKTKSIAYRILAGVGNAYGNSPSLPYEESFFAGGSNDIRAWNARTMAPGGTQLWRDTSSANTQVGDLRLEMNFEYRFEISSLLKFAFFVDAGNIWKIKDDISTENDNLAVFSSDFISQIAVGTGLGMRLDFDFFIFRIDASIPFHNPYMFEGERWIWESRNQYKLELDELPSSYVEGLKRPYSPTLSFGIGYPF